MNSTVALSLATAGLLVVALMILIEILRLRSRGRGPQMRTSRHPRRLPFLEERLRDAFEGPVRQYGEIFVSYTVWRQDQETQLELYSADPWLRLNEFTRSIVVRHLWRALEALTKGAVVIVDSPPQRWTKEADAAFDDQGIDPWAGRQSAGSGSGSQFIKDA